MIQKGVIHVFHSEKTQQRFVCIIFLAPLERGSLEALGNPPSSRSLNPLRSFQDWGHTLRDRLKKEYLGKYIPKGCLFHSLYVEETPKKIWSLFGKKQCKSLPAFPLVYHAPGPRVFTKLMKPVLGLLKQLRIPAECLSAYRPAWLCPNLSQLARPEQALGRTQSLCKGPVLALIHKKKKNV